jgi:hypothetical protein
VTVTFPIDLATVRRALKEAVETQGQDFVYNPHGGACHYRPDRFADPGDPKGKTGCLIGVMLLEILGLDIPSDHLNGIVRDVVALMGGGQWMTTEATNYCQDAQSAQDVGRSWGGAYDIAEESVR